MKTLTFKKLGLVAAAVLALAACGGEKKAEVAADGKTAAAKVEILNVSYDVMRDFYKDFNPLFVEHYKAEKPEIELVVQQSHGGSSKQALQVANGLQADVVTMNQSSDIELLQQKGLVSADWVGAFQNNSVPFTSTTVFLVRKGNPKNIQGWDDLAKEGVSLVIANPKVTGNGRYAFLAAYGQSLKVSGGDHDVAKDFTRRLFANAAVLEAGGRAATTTFVQRNIGDALITFENEANMAAKEFGAGEFEIVYPDYSVAVESPVAVVDAVVEKKGTRAVAQDYLNFLWNEDAQKLAAELYLRPAREDVLAQYAERFPAVETFRANDLLGSWEEIMKTYFADGGVFDEINKR